MRYPLSAPSHIRATIRPPASKSTNNRALIVHALSKGNDVLLNLFDCDDMGVMVKTLTEGGEVTDILVAGTAIRSLAAYLSSTPGTHTIIGTKRMQQHPTQILMNALRELEVNIEHTRNEDFPPLRIEGAPLADDKIIPKGNVSSQYISTLLTIGPILKDGLQLRLTGKVVSRPYTNLTLQLTKDFGASARWAPDQSISVESQPYRCVPFTVESNWSAVSYRYQMVVLSSEADIELTELFRHSYQGNSQGAEVFARLGMETEYTGEGIRLGKNGSCVRRLDEDFADIPNLAQTFVVICALPDVPFRFIGLQSLKIKETNRTEALKAEIEKPGYVLHGEDDDVLYWNGECIEPQVCPVIKTYEDHRIAMAFAPITIHYPTIQIDEPQVVPKPYPRYWDGLCKAGFVIGAHAAEINGRQ